jgi:uncharacterized protein (TIGR02453 family)
MSRFPGFTPEAITFFRGLERNNHRDWFQPRKQIYEQKVKGPMIELVDALNQKMMTFAPDYITDPEKAIYRIYRDVRFSADKTPYKTHIAASFFRHGTPKHGGAGYYFSVAAKEVEVAGGIYMPPTDCLLSVRQHLAQQHEQFRRISSSRPIRTLFGGVQGEQLARVPKGFPADHPAADLLKHKQFLLFVSLEPAVATTPQLFDEVLARFRAMAPWLDFLNAPLTAKRTMAKETLFTGR